MEPQIVACIRMALGPWEWGGILWQVWNLREEILKTLIQCSTWPSDAIKYEAICLVIKYWSDEPVPERPDTRSSEGSSEQREATLSVQRGARPVELIASDGSLSNYTTYFRRYRISIRQLWLVTFWTCRVRRGLRARMHNLSAICALINTAAEWLCWCLVVAR